MNLFTQFLNNIISLTNDEIEIIERLITPRSIEKNKVLFPAEKICDYAAFVKKGLLTATYNKEGEEIFLHFYPENSFAIDYPSFLQGVPAEFTIKALENSELLLLHNKDLQILYNSENPKWNKFGRLIAEMTAINFISRQKITLLKTPEERFEYFLKSNPNLTKRISQYQLANYLGIRPESLSRIKKRTIDRLKKS